LFNRRPDLPVRSHVDVNGTSQVPRRSILCLCPALRPRPHRRSLASLTVSSMLPPRFPRQELQRLMNFGALSRGFGWLAFTGRESNPQDRYKRFQIAVSSSFSGFILAQGKFHVEPPFTSLDHLVGAGAQCRRQCCCSSACAISAISFLVMALPKELNFSATATNAPAPPMTLLR